MLNVLFFNATVSPDGRYLIYGGPSFSGNAGEPPSVVTIEADGSVSEPSPFPRTVPSHRVVISPDNRWVAFVDTPERGGSEVWLASFPDVSSPRLIGSGNNPVWSDTGEDLYFTSEATDGSSVILQVDIDPETGMAAGAPIEAAPLPEDTLFRVIAASPDGERFLISSSLIPSGADRRTFLVEDWTRLLPEGMRRR